MMTSGVLAEEMNRGPLAKVIPPSVQLGLADLRRYSTGSSRVMMLMSGWLIR